MKHGASTGTRRHGRWRDGSNRDGGHPAVSTREADRRLSNLLRLCGNGMMDTEASSATTATRRPATAAAPICQNPGGLELQRLAERLHVAGSAATASSASSEACDDGNTAAGDGCAADCKTVEPGYECRVPGRSCVPACGDGMIDRRRGSATTATPTNGDGCSANLPGRAGRHLHGHAQRLQVVRLRQRHEGRQRGLRLRHQPHRPWPTGCSGANGLFFGDATGCSKTCTQEPTCRTAPTTQACAITLRQRRHRDGRGLRRRQPGRRRRLLVDLHARGRLHVLRRARRTTPRRARSRATAGKCLQLPIILRDFKNEKRSGGHPDFFYLGAPVADPSASPACRARPARPVQQALLRSRTPAVRPRRTTRSTAAGTSRRRRWARTASRCST